MWNSEFLLYSAIHGFCYNIATTPCCLRLCSAGCLEIFPHSSFRSLSALFPPYRTLAVSCHDIALGGAVSLRWFALPSAVNTARSPSVSSTVFISHNKRHTRKCRCQKPPWRQRVRWRVPCRDCRCGFCRSAAAAAGAASACSVFFHFRWVKSMIV